MDSDSKWSFTVQNIMQGFYSVPVSPPYLVCPPDHQVRKEGNPADRAKKRDRKKFS